MIRSKTLALSLLAGAGLFAAGYGAALASQPRAEEGEYVVERDAEVAKEEPGTHGGGGTTTGYNFFAKARNLGVIFRKRALHPGSAIGYHLQKEDEIYYVLSGTGEMTMNGKTFPVGPGTAILTRPGASHGLKQTGKDDLVILINYLRQPRAAAPDAPRGER